METNEKRKQILGRVIRKTRNIINDRKHSRPKGYDKSFLNYINNNYDALSQQDKEIFCDDSVRIDNRHITLRGLCAGFGIDVPEEFENIADEVQSVAFRSKQVQQGDICIIIRSAEEFGTRTMTTRNQYELAIERGAKLIVMGRKDFEKHGLKQSDFPVILMDRINERMLRFFSILRRQQNAKVVMITGSIGKTTTKDFCHTVARKRFRTFANAKNSNTSHQVAKHLLYKTNDKNEVYIQEAGAGYRGSVRFSAAMLQPDIFILTNVYKHHLQVYKTFRNLFKDKTSPDEYLGRNGVIITNYDDKNIRNHQFDHRVKSFAINNEDADYRGINIKQERGYLSFDILEKETGEITGIKVKILGEHNVYNAMAAFIMGKELGMSETEIREALLEYRTEGIRQNLNNIGGIYINMDCYNVAEESIISMLKAGEEYELAADGRRIAMIGGENKLGKGASKRSEAFGKELAAIQMDKVLFCGVEADDFASINKFGDALALRTGFISASNVPNELSTSIDDMVGFLRNNVKRNDLVMVKGIFYLDMSIAVDKVFGTAFSFDLKHYKDNMEVVCGNGCKANLIDVFGEVELFEAAVEDAKLTIPETIEGYPVFRIRKRAFKNHKELNSIYFGNSIKNIGKEAFKNCKGITEIRIPGNIKVIEDEAFSGCTNLKRVIVEDGVTHIGRKAFAKCNSLEEVSLPSTIGMMEGAFPDCKNIVIK